MEHDGATDFKSIRARFQEEIDWSRSKNKPVIPEKPKHVPPPETFTSLLSSINVTVEKNSLVVRRAAVFKDDKKFTVHKRPISYPVSPLTGMLPFNVREVDRDETVRQTFTDRKLPLILPVPPMEKKLGIPPPLKTFPTPEKHKKKTLLLFKSTKGPKPEPEFSDVSKESANANPTLKLSANTVKVAGGESVSGRSWVVPEEAHSDTKSLSPGRKNPATAPLAEDGSTQNTNPGYGSCVSNASEGKKKKLSHLSPVDGFPSTAESAARLSPKLTSMDCESQSKKVLKTTRVSPVQTKGLTHRVNLQTLEECVGGTRVLRPGLTEEVPPARIRLPSIESLGLLPDKPSRPPHVDLGLYQTTVSKAREQCDLVLGREFGAHGAIHRVDSAHGPEVPEVPELLDPECADLNTPHPEARHLSTAEPKVSELGAPELPDFGLPILEVPEPEVSTTEAPQIPSFVTGSTLASVGPEAGHYKSCENVYEDVEAVTKFRHGQYSWKRKSMPKNPYADIQKMSEDSYKTLWFHNSCNDRRGSPEAHDDKEQKKMEKQRLGKEKKEQKEREKKENEMKKKFKITGQEEPLYQANVTIASKKGHKNDLPVKNGDVISIIRTTNCPKGKWLARDSDHKYGYISVMNVELDIKEMLELGKKATQASCHGAVEGDTVSMGSRCSNHHPTLTSSFTDDSEEWTGDEESCPSETWGHSRTASIPEMCYNNAGAQHTFSDGSSEDSSAHTTTRHEALQKLATFFQQQQENSEVTTGNGRLTPTKPLSLLNSVEEQSYFEHEEDFQLNDVMILPPPELYADST